MALGDHLVTEEERLACCTKRPNALDPNAWTRLRLIPETLTPGGLTARWLRGNTPGHCGKKVAQIWHSDFGGIRKPL